MSKDEKAAWTGMDEEIDEEKLDFDTLDTIETVTASPLVGLGVICLILWLAAFLVPDKPIKDALQYVSVGMLFLTAIVVCLKKAWYIIWGQSTETSKEKNNDRNNQ